MTNYFYLELDTTSPSNPSLSIEGGSTYTSNQLISLALGTTDSTTTGYQMKIWGDIDESYDSNMQSIENNSTWITFNGSKQVKLSIGDSAKTVYIKIRDDVWNESGQVSDSIILDTQIPTVTVTNPDVDIISKDVGKNVASLSFSSDSAFKEYKVKVVNSVSAAHDTGTVIAIDNGFWFRWTSKFNLDDTTQELPMGNGFIGDEAEGTTDVNSRDHNHLHPIPLQYRLKWLVLDWKVRHKKIPVTTA